MTGNPISRWSWLTRERLTLLGLLLFTLLVRGGVLYALRGNLQQDPDAYREIAENLLRHGVFAMGKSPGETYDPTRPPQPTAYRPPLYPVLLSNLPASAAKGHEVSLLKVAAVHVLLGVGTVLLTWLTAKRIQNSEFRIRNAGARRVGPASAGPPGISSTEQAESGVGGPTSADAGLSHPTVSQPTLLPLVAGLLVACDPILLNQSTLVMTETLATFLAVLSLWCLARFDTQRAWFNAGLAGGAIGLAILCRPTFLPWLGLVAGAMLLMRGREIRIQNAEFRTGKAAKRGPWWRDVGWRFANVAALLVVAGAVVSPWVIRNYQVFGKPIVATTHGGYTLWLGNNPSFYGWLRHDESGVPWQAFYPPVQDTPYIREAVRQARESIHEGEPQEVVEDVEHRSVAIGAIFADRTGFLHSCFYRGCQLWSPLPNRLTADESTNRRLLRYATAAWYCGIYILAAIGVWKLRWRMLASPWVWGVLLCVAFTAVHTFYWSNLRMRAPLIPFVAIVASAALLPRSRG